MTQKYDVVIVGAGPAGATLARLLANKRVLLIDGGTKEKPCGGLLAPDAQKALAMFDLTLPKDVLVDPQIFSVRTMDLESGVQQWYQRMYINMNRKKFDDWLVSLVPPTVDIVKGKCTKIDGRRITFVSGSISQTIETDVVVGADGAHSIVRRTFFGKLKTRTYVAIQQWFKNEDLEVNPFYSCIFDQKTSDSCSWTIHKDEYIIFGGAFAPKGSRDQFELQKMRLKRFGIELDNPVKTEACQVLRPSNRNSFINGLEREDVGVYLIGEAAGFISPSSLEGFSSAFISAVALSESLDKKQTLRNYLRKTRFLKIKLLLKNLKGLFMYVPFLRNMVMRSGVDSISVRSR